MLSNFSYSATPKPNVTSEDNETCVSSPANVTLKCHWYGSSYYVAWYKDSGLIYFEDLSVPNVLMQASVGFVVESSYSSRTSTLTILSSSIDDSGNYTCAVSCRARDVDFSMIDSNLASSIIVAVFGECTLFCERVWSCLLLCPLLFPEQPQVPGGFEGRVLEDGSSPTVSFEWMLLDMNEDGIPLERSKGLQYIITVKDGGSVVDSTTVDDPMNSTVFTGLPLCNDLTGILEATNGLLTSVETNTTVQVTESSECAFREYVCVPTAVQEYMRMYIQYMCQYVHVKVYVFCTY